MAARRSLTRREGLTPARRSTASTSQLPRNKRLDPRGATRHDEGPRSTLDRTPDSKARLTRKVNTVKTDRQALRLAGKASPRDHSRGSPLAKTTLVAYGDFASPACSQTYRTVKTIQRKMGTSLRYVYRSFPQPEQFTHSEQAAEAAECASSQGKFWEMHDSMFECEPGSRGIPLSQCAEEAGLDLLRFRREMQAHVHAERIHGVREGGIRSGVETAPAFFINSVRHESSFGLATLLAAVQAASGGESDRVEDEVPAERKSRGKRQGARGGSPC
jgi:formate-nitrite transporter family protein